MKQQQQQKKSRFLSTSNKFIGISRCKIYNLMDILLFIPFYGSAL
jgi:hypothetical protein